MRFEYTDGNNQDFVRLCAELDQFLNRLVGGEENRSEYISYNQPDDIHDVIMVYDGTVPVGCAGFKHYDGEQAEVKRVFVCEAYRGHGIAERMMVMLEAAAEEKGYACLILESGELLEAAMRLYRKMGFQIIPNYGQYKDMPESVCMQKVIKK